MAFCTTNDPVVVRFDREATCFRAEAIENFLTVEVSIRQAHHQAPYTPLKQSRRTYNLQIHGQPPQMVEVLLLGSGLSILRHGRQISVLDVLQSAPRQLNPLEDGGISTELRQARGWVVLQEWWKINGMCFQFLALPRELRELVYAQALDQLVPFPCHKSRRLGHFAKPQKPAMMALRLVNRQINMEATTHISVHHQFTFTLTPLLVQAVQDTWLSQHMRHVQLNDRSCGCSRCDCSQRRQHLLELRALNLQSLRVIIRTIRTREGYSALPRQCLFSGLLEPLSGQPCHVATPKDASDQCAELNAQLKVTREEYVQWRACALHAGLADASLRAWDEWRMSANRDDGGVLVTTQLTSREHER